jgi:hypothetical protein
MFSIRPAIAARRPDAWSVTLTRMFAFVSAMDYISSMFEAFKIHSQTHDVQSSALRQDWNEFLCAWRELSWTSLKLLGLLLYCALLVVFSPVVAAIGAGIIFLLYKRFILAALSFAIAINLAIKIAPWLFDHVAGFVSTLF